MLREAALVDAARASKASLLKSLEEKRLSPLELSILMVRFFCVHLHTFSAETRIIKSVDLNSQNRDG